MKVFITGVGGFIGGHLASYLSTRGHVVSGSTRGRGAAGDTQPERIHTLPFGASPSPDIFQCIDVLVHCAHDFTPGAGGLVVDGTTAISDTARRAGVPLQLFVSSLSARADASSEYGATKWRLEEFFHRNKEIVVRPGTVMGRGGVFGRLLRLVERSPILVLPDGGTARLYLIGIEDLCRAIDLVIRQSDVREHNLYYPASWTLRQLIQVLCRQQGRRRLIVPVPARLLMLPLSLAHKMRIRLPIDAANMKGFMKSQQMPYQSTLEHLLGPSPSLEDAVRTAIGI